MSSNRANLTPYRACHKPPTYGRFYLLQHYNPNPPQESLQLYTPPYNYTHHLTPPMNTPKLYNLTPLQPYNLTTLQPYGQKKTRLSAGRWLHTEN